MAMDYRTSLFSTKTLIMPSRETYTRTNIRHSHIRLRVPARNTGHTTTRPQAAIGRESEASACLTLTVTEKQILYAPHVIQTARSRIRTNRVPEGLYGLVYQSLPPPIRCFRTAQLVTPSTQLVFWVM